MIFKFFFFYKQLNLTFFILKKREKVFQQMELQEIEVVKIFEYRKDNNNY